jgi:hypothetical protein
VLNDDQDRTEANNVPGGIHEKVISIRKGEVVLFERPIIFKMIVFFTEFTGGGCWRILLSDPVKQAGLVNHLNGATTSTGAQQNACRFKADTTGHG